METSRFVDGLRADLAAAAALGDQAIVEAADRLARAVESSVRMHLLDALQEAAMELTAQLPNGRIDVRLSGGDVQLTFVGDEPAAPAGDDDTSARVTLRLSERLKGQAEAAAGREGVSLNTWLVRTVAAGVGRRTVGNRLRGYIALVLNEDTSSVNVRVRQFCNTFVLGGLVSSCLSRELKGQKDRQGSGWPDIGAAGN